MRARRRGCLREFRRVRQISCLQAAGTLGRIHDLTAHEADFLMRRPPPCLRTENQPGGSGDKV
jgi:hypothetical protein